MQELSLHILDIATNSVSAKANEIKIEITESRNKDLFRIEIIDNGIGMDKAFLESVTDPFVTTRTTRKVGLGISLFKMAAELTGGCFAILSEVGKGTTVIADFIKSSIDRPPLGDIASTYTTLLSTGSARNINFIFCYSFEGEDFCISSNEIKEILGQDTINDYDVIKWIQDFINSNIKELNERCLNDENNS
jgi:hypothetical protein